jgi:hypothetical protein
MSMRALFRRQKRREKFTIRNRTLYWTRLYEWIFNGSHGKRSSSMERWDWIRQQARETLHEPPWNLPQR